MQLSTISLAITRLGFVWDPWQLFAVGEVGVWYDPSDLGSMFQLSNGTTAAVIEGPVGYIADKSGNGKHATQATAASRPTLSARVNLLTKTEDFSNAAWQPTGGSISGSPVLAPDGTMTAQAYTKGTTGDFGWLIQVLTGNDASKAHTFSIWVQLSSGTPASGGIIISDYTLASISSPTATIDTTWQKITFSITAGQLSNTTYIGVGFLLGNFANGTVFNVWHPSLVPADQASLPYQRVDTATVYDTVGFPTYLKFDGVDDSLATGSIDFTAGDKMTVVAGVRKLSDAPQILFELSADANANNGTLRVVTGADGAFYYNCLSRGDAAASINQAAGFALPLAPDTAVFSSKEDIAGDLSTIRRNGVAGTPGTGDKGAGNFGNYPLYIGSRAGASLYFNGHIYSLIVRGAQSTDAQIVSAETYVNGKTGAY